MQARGRAAVAHSGKSTPRPARLDVILAREANTAIVIWQAPSGRCATFSWDRTTDEFRLGQWLNGRVYTEESDLSPDGEHFVYFAGSEKIQLPANRSWLAISKAPYLKALKFDRRGAAGYAGGLFLDNQSFSVFGGEITLPGFQSVPHETLKARFGPMERLYFARLQLSGWRRVKKDENFSSFTRDGLPMEWELTKEFRRESESHKLTLHGKQVAGENWDWADWDSSQSRVVWTSGGCLYGARLEAIGLGKETLIHDFNPYRFEVVKAPY